MKWTYFIILLIIGLPACRDFDTEVRVNSIDAKDGSLTVDDSTFSSYVEFYKNHVYKNLFENDRTINLSIDEQSMAKGYVVYSEDFSGKDFLGNKHIVTHAKDSAHAHFLLYKQSQLDLIDYKFAQAKKDRKPYAHYTDILRTLLLASKYVIRDTIKQGGRLQSFLNFAKGKKKIENVNLITIQSDMRNDERGDTSFCFDRFTNLSKEEVLKRLDRLGQLSMIADLKGCYVIVNGATTSGRQSARLYENIQFFWQEYFKRSGATLLAYGYDSSLDIEDFFKKQHQ